MNPEASADRGPVRGRSNRRPKLVTVGRRERTVEVSPGTFHREVERKVEVVPRERTDCQRRESKVEARRRKKRERQRRKANR